jgi:DoxX-like family
MKQKAKIILKWTLTVLVALIIGFSACMKLIALPPLVEIYSRIGLLEYMRTLGAIELVLFFVFLFRRTMKLGFLLLTGWFGGAMAVELSHGNVFIFPAIILVLLWTAAFVRDPSIFKSSHHKRQVLSA